MVSVANAVTSALNPLAATELPDPEVTAVIIPGEATVTVLVSASSKEIENEPATGTTIVVTEVAVAVTAPAASYNWQYVPVIASTEVAAFATGVETAEITPAVSTDAATTAIRCLIVFLDIVILSIVESEYFPASA
jgi:hypothetical protein